MYSDSCIGILCAELANRLERGKYLFKTFLFICFQLFFTSVSFILYFVRCNEVAMVSVYSAACADAQDANGL